MEQITDLNQILIDGSMLEGGGQLFRTSISLSYLLNQSLIISNIRSNRPSPGLGNQHLTCVNELFKIINQFNYFKQKSFQIVGNVKKSTRLHIQVQNDLSQKNFVSEWFFKVEQLTVGSINLVLQCLMPCLIFQYEQNFTLRIQGGTSTSKQPQPHIFKYNFLPILEKMGEITVQYNIGHPGYFPDIIGFVDCKIKALSKQSKLKSIQLTQRGKILSFNIYISYTKGNAEEFYHKRFKPFILDQINSIEQFKNIQTNFIDESLKKVVKAKASSFSCEAILKCQYDTLLACELLIENKFQSVDKQLDEFKSSINDMIIQESIVVDEFSTDQLLIFMALAEGTSIIHTGSLNKKSKHIETQIKLLQQMIPDLEIKVEDISEQINYQQNQQKYQVNKIMIKGVGFINN